MRMISDECIEFDEQRRICIAEDHGKKYTLENDSGYQIQKVKVDGCLAQNENEKRCDYLFKIETANPRHAIFIELKGGDLITAIRQVSETIDYLGDELKDYKFLVRIVGSRDVPRMKLNPAYKKLIKLIPIENFKYATNCFLKEAI